MSTGIPGIGNATTPQVWTGASMRASLAQKMSNLFGQIDTSGSGTITKAQFEQAFQTLNPPPAVKAMGADQIWAQLDPNGTGSVSKQDFVNGMQTMIGKARHHHPHHHHAAGANATDTSATASPTPAQTLAQSLQSLVNFSA